MSIRKDVIDDEEDCDFKETGTSTADVTFPALPSELWERIIKHTTAANVAFEVNHELHEMAKTILADVIPPHLTTIIDAKDSFLQSDVCDVLLLSAAKVRTYPYEVRRRRGGGEYHVFDSDTVYNILESEGGMPAYHDRRLAKRKRELNKRKREADLQARVTNAKDKLEAGLHILGLKLRSDSTLCAEYIASGGKKPELRYVIYTMAHMHYLHEYTNGRYKAAVREAVQERGEYKGYHPGIYRFCAEEVQADEEFSLPDRLPWMPDTAACTTDLLKQAVRAAEPPAPVPAAKGRKKACAAK